MGKPGYLASPDHLEVNIKLLVIVDNLPLLLPTALLLLLALRESLVDQEDARFCRVCGGKLGGEK